MADTVIKVEGLSKLYRLGEVGTGSLAHDINRWWHRMRGKEDPYSRVGQLNDRTRKADGDWVWALKDINFEVKQGEVLGIIGRNGAGKSTLLKILSRVAGPTAGQVKVKGRIASLLEVGTGFHPELTGRDNIFLNGAILGMTKAEISRKLDQIVEFSGCAAYLDTPVKRYSSGMQVRLAFAVAAHLEPEVLIVDEVLAVGDAEFQKKCIGRMSEVAGEGRTVLFVSHNMQAITELCHRVLMVTQGTIAAFETPQAAIQTYLGETSAETSDWTRGSTAVASKGVSLLRARICDAAGLSVSTIPYRSRFCLEVQYQEHELHEPWTLAFGVSDQRGQFVFWTWDVDHMVKTRTEGRMSWTSTCWIPGELLAPGKYHVTFSACELSGGQLQTSYEHHDRAIEFTISPEGFINQHRGGVVAPRLEWRRVAGEAG